MASNIEIYKNCSITFKEAYSSIIKDYISSEQLKFKIDFDELDSTYIVDRGNIWIEPKTVIFFDPKVGPIKSVELFALLLKIKLELKDSKVVFTVTGQFNPNVFKPKKMHYQEIDQVVLTGTNRLILKDFDISDESVSVKINEGLANYISKAFSFYFAKNL